MADRILHYRRHVNTNLKRTLSVLAASAGAIAIATVGASSTIAAAPDVFSVTSLTTDNAVYTDASSVAGDDDGFLGVTGSKFLFSGDTATVAYDLADLENGYVTDVSNTDEENNWLFSDLKTQTSYFFIADSLGNRAYDLTGFQPLDQTGDVGGTVVTLSETISVDNEPEYCTILASGYGRVAIWDGCLGVVYDIELPSGVVTTIEDVATFADYDASSPLLLDWFEVSTWVSQAGIVEFDGSALHILAVSASENDYPASISRYDIQGTTEPTEVLSFGDDPEGAGYVDLWKFTASPATNQWCSGAEGGWEPISGDDEISELAFCASATFAIGSAPAPVEPALANTGLDLTSTIVAGAVVLLAGAGLVLVARRRTATN